MKKHIIIACLLLGWYACQSDKPQNQQPTIPSIWAKVDSTKFFKGKRVFCNEGCCSCHNISMLDRSTGPALAESIKIPRAWLYQFTRNSGKMISEGDSLATALFNTWAKSVMTPYPDLSDEELDVLYYFIENQVTIQYKFDYCYINGARLVPVKK